MKKGKVYPLAEFSKKMRNYKAMTTGEYRPPKKDEWYISGAIPKAYKAMNNLSASYHIAKIVRILPVDDCIINIFFEDANFPIKERIKYCCENCKFKCIKGKEYKRRHGNEIRSGSNRNERCDR